MWDVFISYSHNDLEFVEHLYNALTDTGLQVWVDLKGIPYSAPWWQEICEGIDDADNFAFVISLESLKSQYCNLELEYARSANKRIVPILRSEFDRKELNAVLFRTPWELTARANWKFIEQIQHLPMRAEDDFDHALTSFVETLKLDLDYVKLHTRLTVRAREWSENRNASLLLRGQDLQHGEDWLAASSLADKQPAPTDLIRLYIRESRLEEARITTETNRIQFERYRLSIRQLLGLRFFGAFLGNWMSFGYLIYYQYTLNDPQGWFRSQSILTGVSVGAVLGLGLALVIMLAAEGRRLLLRRRWWIGWAASLLLCLLVFTAYGFWDSQPTDVLWMLAAAFLFTGGFALAALLTRRHVSRAFVGGFGVLLALYVPFASVGHSAVFDLTGVSLPLTVIFALLIGVFTYMPEILGVRQRVNDTQALSQPLKGDVT